jgi:SAM-dependent methyltransferase
VTVELVNPTTGKPLTSDGDALADEDGARFPLVSGIPRFGEVDNYTGSFGTQWNIFRETQLDTPGVEQGPTEQRFFAETGWEPAGLAGLDILEVGSGAGRFSQVILSRTRANLYSVDYSTAVEASLANNGAIAPERFHLFQASIHEMPFPDNSFDKVFCLGVLQHTPDFEKSVQSLVRKAKTGGEIVVDFYCIRGFWTRISAKYLLRSFTRRMPQQRLLRTIERNIGWLIKAHQGLTRLGLSALTRFLPIVDLRTFPPGLTPEQLREWAVLDTFDIYSPEYDNPQRIADVADMFWRGGAEVTFAGMIETVTGPAAVVRAMRP